MTSAAVVTKEQIEEKVRERLKEELAASDEQLAYRSELIALPGASPSKLLRASRAIERDFNVSCLGTNADWFTSVRVGVERVSKALGPRFEG
ncbi:hypothetical protein ACWGJ2_38915 [Streptomyces sp. NPDC054796]